MSYYVLQVHARDVTILENLWLFGDTISVDVGRHTGYDLIEYEGDVIKSIKTLDLSLSNGDIDILYKDSSSPVTITYNGETQIWNEQIHIDKDWMSVDQTVATAKRFETSVVATGENALVAFNKMNLNGKFLTALLKINKGIDYKAKGQNCNTWTNTMAQDYLGGQNVFNEFNIGIYAGDTKTLSEDFSGQDKKQYAIVETYLSKFYESINGKNVDYSNAEVILEKSNEEWYTVIKNCNIDGKSYVFAFDNDGGNTIEHGSDQNSFIYAGDGNNVINSGNGNDEIHGGKDDDIINAGNGNNSIIGYDGKNRLTGGKDDDKIYGGNDTDTVRTGAGKNEVYTYAGADTVYTNDGSLESDINYVYLGAGSDTFTGGKGIDIVDGGSLGSIYGSDVSGDTNTINLGGGNDIYSGGEEKDIVHGGTGRDYLSGYGGKNELYGEKGDDYLFGGDGNNKLDAGTGRDVIYTSGKGKNEIFLGKDLCSDLVMVGGTGVDHIYQATEVDYFHYDAGIASTMNSGKDYIVYLTSGKKIVIHDFIKDDEDDDDNGGNEGDNGNNKYPFFITPDGTVWGYSSNGDYTPTDTTIPVGELPINEKPIPGEDITSIPPLPPFFPEPEEPEGPENPDDPDGDDRKKDKPLDENWDPKKTYRGPYNDLINRTPPNGVELDRGGIQTALNNDVNKGDPLILDLDGDGVEIIEGDYYYDLDQNELAEKIDWISPDDGFLVHDENNNDIVDGINELFGNTKIDGYDELKTYDTNNDGKIDKEDQNFNELKIWRDLNSNGISDAGELKSLEEHGITELLVSGREHIYSNGKNITQKIGTAITNDGSSIDMHDVFFAIDSNLHKYAGNIEIPDDIKNLPNLKGLGLVHDLHIAATKDETLKNLLIEISNIDGNDLSDFPNKVHKLINRWAVAEEIDPTIKSGVLSGQIVYLLRQFSGIESITQIRFTNTSDTLQKIYSDFYNSVVQTLLVQTIFKNFENYSGEYFADLNMTLNVSEINFSNLMQEVSTISIKDNPVVAYNIYQILNNITFTQDIDRSIFSQEIFNFLDKNELSFLTEPLLNDKVVVTSGINNPEADKYYIITGTDTDEYIMTSQNDDYISAGAGDDMISSEAGNDIIIGGKGNDHIIGGSGDNTYIFNLGDGNDVISNESSVSEEINNDILKFGKNIKPSDIDVIKQGYDLILKIKNNDDSVRIYNYFYRTGNLSSSINEIIFSDGTKWNYEYIRDLWREGELGEGYGIIKSGNNLSGTEGNDVLMGTNNTITGDSIYGYEGNDIITGGKGNDLLFGGDGNDTYIYNRGDGYDQISESSGQDQIKFGKGISANDLKFYITNNTLMVIINNDFSQGVEILNFFSTARAIEKLVFNNGSFIRLSEVGLNLNVYKTPEAQNTYSNGSIYGDTINGTNLNDTIYAGEGNDIIYGGNGDDTINGGNGDDVYHGGKGNDNSSDYNGSDTYHYNLGDGFDYIYDTDYENDNIDKIVFGEGITFEDLKFRIKGSNLSITIKGDETQGIEIYAWQTATYKIEKFVFADGSEVAINDIGLTFHQKDEDTSVNATPHDDIIYAGNGNNYITTGEGNNIIYSGNGDDIINGGTGNDIYYTGKGNDTFSDSDGSDTYHYNLGDGYDYIMDTDYENDDIDKIVFGEGITFEDLKFRIKGSNLSITIKGDETQGIEIYAWQTATYKIEKFVFADGSEVAINDIGLTFHQKDEDTSINATPHDDIIYAGNGNNYITTGEGNNIIYSGNGDDIINGGTGNDIYYTGKGNDTFSDSDGSDTYHYNLGDGYDYIMDTDYENDDIDKIVFGEGITFEDLKFRIKGSNLSITIKGDETQGIEIYAWQTATYKIEKFVFADGSEVAINDIGLTFHQKDEDTSVNATPHDDIIYAGNGNNYITTGEGNNIIYSGNGDDIINGGTGNDIYYTGKGNDTFSDSDGSDTYHYNLGDGYDYIMDTDYENDDIDKIVFGEGITFEDLKFRIKGSNLSITIKGDETQGIEIYAWQTATYKIEKFVFADGSEVAINDIGLTFHQKDEDTSVNATPHDDIIYAGNGNNYITTGEGNNIIYSGNGDDIINGGTGNDIYYTGKGNDTFSDSDGSDTYHYNLGDGYDYIMDTDYENDDIDKIVFGEGITFEDLKFRIKGSNLSITIKGDETQGIEIYAWQTATYKIEKFVFADGSEVAINDIGLTFHQKDEDTSVNATPHDDIIYAGNGNNYITTGEGNNIIYSGNGDDIINGGTGNDIYYTGKGNDTFSDSDGSDTYHYNLGDGYDYIMDTDYENDDIDKIVFGEGITFEDLKFRIKGSNLSITIKGDETQGIEIYAWQTATYKIEKFVFADGSEVAINDIGLTFHQKDEDTSINATPHDDIIYAGNGNNYITTGEGNNIIYSGNGDDIINGGTGNDIYYTGKGNDTFSDSDGSDTYHYNLGDGFDYINDTDYENDDIDKIVFGEGITAHNLDFVQEANSLIIRVDEEINAGMRIENHFLNSGIEMLEFSDGTSIDISQYKSSEQLIQAMSSFGNLSSSNLSFGIQEFQIIENVITANSLKGTAA